MAVALLSRSRSDVARMVNAPIADQIEDKLVNFGCYFLVIVNACDEADSKQHLSALLTLALYYDILKCPDL